MSVNKLWTLIYNNQEDEVSTLRLVSSPTRIQVSTEIFKSYLNTTQYDNNMGSRISPWRLFGDILCCV